MPLNIEFKAKVNDLYPLEERLLAQQPYFAGEDFQTDTYFKVPAGRLKLREGTIENALIYYQRSDTATAKQSDVLLYQHEPEATLKKVLATALGIKVVVQKIRKIYFVENVKIHFDTLSGLGNFVEVEAIDQDGTLGVEKLKAQCLFYAGLFNIQPGDYVAHSYSDMLL